MAVRGIAVSHAGELFAASYDGKIHRFAPTGVLLQSLASGTWQLIDIDLSQDGRIAAASRLGKVVLTSEALSAPVVISLPASGDAFVAFAEVPRDPLIFADGFTSGFLTLWTTVADE